METEATPDALFQLFGGHMAAKYLFVATQMGLFERLAQGPLPLDELARRVGMPPRTARILADALVALGLLERHAAGYANAATPAAFLAGNPGPDLRPLVRLWDQILYRQWATLEQALRTGDATLGYADFSPAEQHTFSVGVDALTAPAAQALASVYDFGRQRALLDLGGGTGSFLRAAQARHPALRGALFERPDTAAAVRQMPGGAALEIVEGDLLRDPLPPGYDAVLLANVVHLFSPETNRALLRRIRAAVEPGARLLLVDFWMDATHTRPLFGALLAAEFVIVTGEGDVYSAEEVGAWLAATGWRLLEHTPLAGPASLFVAAAV